MTQGQVIDIIIMGAFSILTAYSITVFRKAHRSSEFRRNLYGIYTDVFWGLRERKKSLEEIFNEIWPLARNNNL